MYVTAIIVEKITSFVNSIYVIDYMIFVKTKIKNLHIKMLKIHICANQLHKTGFSG